MASSHCAVVYSSSCDICQNVRRDRVRERETTRHLEKCASVWEAWTKCTIVVVLDTIIMMEIPWYSMRYFTVPFILHDLFTFLHLPDTFI